MRTSIMKSDVVQCSEIVKLRSGTYLHVSIHSKFVAIDYTAVVTPVNYMPTR